MWLNMQIFGFRALWTPYYLSFICVVALLYFLFTGPLRHYFGDVRRPSVKQQILFYSGLILVYAVKGAPVDLLSHIMMGAHMIQMALLYLLAPVWFILGILAWMWQWFIVLIYVWSVFRFLFFLHSFIVLSGFILLFAIYHIPFIFDFSKASPTAHILITVGLFILACFMWWPILSPVEKYDTLQPLLKIGFLVISAFIVSI